MKRILAVCRLGVMSLTAFAAHAEMSVEAARASVAPFYKALNAEFAKDSPELVRQATAPDWVSCRGNDVCNSRDEVIAGIGARLKSVPDLTWQIREVLVSGNQVIVRGEAVGTPADLGFTRVRLYRLSKSATADLDGRVHGAPHRQILQGHVDRRAHAGWR